MIVELLLLVLRQLQRRLLFCVLCQLETFQPKYETSIFQCRFVSLQFFIKPSYGGLVVVPQKTGSAVPNRGRIGTERVA